MITEYHTLISFFYKDVIKLPKFFAIGLHKATHEAYPENDQDEDQKYNKSPVTETGSSHLNCLPSYWSTLSYAGRNSMVTASDILKIFYHGRKN